MRWSSMFAVLTAGGLAIACSSGSKGLSVRASAAGDTTTGGDVLKLNGDTITIDRVRMVVRKVEIEGTPSSGACTPTPPPAATPTAGTGTTTAPSSGPDDRGGMGGSGGSGGGGSDDGSGHDGEAEGDHDGECELEFGPFAVDLSGAALVQGIHQQFDIPVPAGTYREIKFKIDTLDAGKAGSDAVLQEMATLHASIAIDGTIDGKAFHFTTPMEVESEREGAITVDPSTGAGLTLDLSPTGWFTAADGTTRLDPSAPTDQGAILANLRASLRLAHDDDGDGCDDDTAACPDHHGGDGGGGSGRR